MRSASVGEVARRRCPRATEPVKWAHPPGAFLQFRPKSFRCHSVRIESLTMATLSLQNPLFATYVIAATLMILKVVSMSWLTVVRMMQVKGGFRSPEDLH